MAGKKRSRKRLSLELVRAVKSGNNDALGRMIDICGENIDAVLWRIAPWQMPEAHDDCRQNISMELARLIKRKYNG